MTDPPTDPAPDPPDPKPGPPTEPLPVAGPVSTMEELANVQQIAFVSQWLRFFTHVAPSPRKLQAGRANLRV